MSEIAADRINPSLYRMLDRTVGAVLRRYMHYTGEMVDEAKGPFIVLANHTTDLDPIYLVHAFREPLYFVASEHVFRKGFVSSVLERIFHPIHRLKGTTDATAAKLILKRVRDGCSVAMFPEGNRNYNGVTGACFPATGKLIRLSGADLYTYRIKGGYLRTPRWSRTFRDGRIRGEKAGYYPAAMLRSMQPEEINELIRRDLYVDAFAEQEKDGSRYDGKTLAEYLETAFYICPSCGRMHTMRSKDDTFACSACGYAVKMTDTGRFLGDKVIFETPRDWDRWQSEQMNGIKPEDVLLEDDEVITTIWDADGACRVLPPAPLRMTGTEIGFGRRTLPLSVLTGMGNVGRAKINFSAEGIAYQLSSKDPRWCGRKYTDLFLILKKKEGAVETTA